MENINGKDIKIYDIDIETGKAEFEVGITTSSNMDEIEMTLVGIEKLVGSIDLRADCNDDYEVYRQALKRVLFAAADNYGFQGGYYSVNPEIKIQYDDDDEGFVSDEDKMKALQTLIKEL
jgi:hypothetical protein